MHRSSPGISTPFATSLALLVFCCFVPATQASAETVFSSGPNRVALMELYTSEGCSSCPPADRWLSGLKDDPGLWHDYVPVAFHVDYWNYIGWDDRFATREFSDRQRRYADEGGTRVVYTPGFFRDGRDWRGWRSGSTGAVDDTVAGELVAQIDDERVSLRFDNLSTSSGRLDAHVALLGMNLETEVRAGENKGRTLRHDFVALDLQSVAMKRTGKGYVAEVALQEVAADVQDLALAVWVSPAKTQEPLQAAGGYLTFRRSFVFPIKTYRTFENDPLEGLTTALSNIPHDGQT